MKSKTGRDMEMTGHGNPKAEFHFPSALPSYSHKKEKTIQGWLRQPSGSFYDWNILPTKE